MILSGYQTAKGSIALNQRREICMIVVENRGDRPIQVGLHHHFYEVNLVLCFDRLAARGLRLNIAAGIVVRLEPGQEHEVKLMRVAGV